MKKLKLLIGAIVIGVFGAGGVANAVIVDADNPNLITCKDAAGKVYTTGSYCTSATTNNNMVVSGECSTSFGSPSENCRITNCSGNATSVGSCACSTSCSCSDGKYSDTIWGVYSDIEDWEILLGYQCTTCPSSGTSDSGNNDAITDCYTSNEIYDSSIHGTKKQVCYYKTSPAGYNNCNITDITKCDGGYYRALSYEMFCTAVGDTYYSANGDLIRTLCPTYDNPSGVATRGKTAGGTEADNINDCRIPMSEVFTTTSGKYRYNPYCKYSTGISVLP
ncbi:hypothetical protein LJC18_00185 [Lachnospiraceae bacterium OttesenSCG-928-E19]|nr:hypothetical protein [Lachnospiraceae bacterium OttesenSCG-928-E19]